MHEALKLNDRLDLIEQAIISLHNRVGPLEAGFLKMQQDLHGILNQFAARIGELEMKQDGDRSDRPPAPEPEPEPEPVKEPEPQPSEGLRRHTQPPHRRR